VPGLFLDQAINGGGTVLRIERLQKKGDLRDPVRPVPHIPLQNETFPLAGDHHEAGHLGQQHGHDRRGDQSAEQ
jgi:hypothetical protein